jgi:CxxC-x17-CxxC domain-containing protein
MAFGKNFKGGARDFGRPRDDRGAGGFGGDRGFKPRGSFGGDRGPVEMHPATCVNCNKACEVPFRPNGQKPVYCKDCFGSMKGADDRGPREDRGDRGGFGARSDSRSDSRSDRPAYAPRPDSGSPAAGNVNGQIDKLTAKIDALAKSLDYAITLMKGTAPATAVKPVEVKAAPVVEFKKAEAATAKKSAPATSKDARLEKKAVTKKIAMKASKAKK